MPWVYIWTSELKSAYVGTTPVKEIYVGTTKVRPEAMLVEFLLVWGGWPWGRGHRRWGWWWGGAGGVVYCAEFPLTWNMNVVIWAWWCRIEWNQAATIRDCQYAKPSCFGDIIAYGGGIGGYRWYYNTWFSWWSGGGGVTSSWQGGAGCPWQWNNGGSGCWSAWWWWGYSEPWGNGGEWSYWGHGLCSDITWQYCRYWSGWWWAGSTNNEASYGWGSASTVWCPATSRWGGWWAANGRDNASWAWCQWIFVLRYPTACWYNISWWTKYTCWDYTIHCFTSNWTLTVS